MRFPAVLVPAVFLLAGTFYFFAKAKATAAQPAVGAVLDYRAPEPSADMLADESDRQTVRGLLGSRDLSPDQTNILVRAAGRRYMRRKLALAAAQQAVDAGKAAPAALDSLRSDLESARKVCDLAESFDRRRELTAMAQADWELERQLAFMPSTMPGLAERFSGSTGFTEADLEKMEQAFQKQFGKPLPVSARGDGPVHRALGFDHSGRFDLALSPSQPEGLWARRYLTERNVSFFAFRSAVPGRATGAHIHIGPASTHRAPKG